MQTPTQHNETLLRVERYAEVTAVVHVSEIERPPAPHAIADLTEDERVIAAACAQAAARSQPRSSTRSEPVVDGIQHDAGCDRDEHRVAVNPNPVTAARRRAQVARVVVVNDVPRRIVGGG